MVFIFYFDASWPDITANTASESILVQGVASGLVVVKALT